MKTLVTCQGVAHIAHPHQGYIPNMFHLQDFTQFADQKNNVIAGALFAKLPELRKVFADLCGRDAHLLAQLLRRGVLLVLCLHPAQGSQVNREFADNDIGNFSLFHGLLPNMVLLNWRNGTGTSYAIY